jgi:hypothetical protein
MSIASALKAAAACAGKELTITLVCVARCVRYTERAANAHLPVVVRERLVAALDADDAASGCVVMEEGEVGGAVYQVLNYVKARGHRKSTLPVPPFPHQMHARAHRGAGSAMVVRELRTS